MPRGGAIIFSAVEELLPKSRVEDLLAATWWLCPVTSFGPFSFT
jgi:hypothetical protein